MYFRIHCIFIYDNIIWAVWNYVALRKLEEGHKSVTGSRWNAHTRHGVPSSKHKTFNQA